MIRTYIKQIRNNSHSLGEMLDIIWCTVRYGASPNNYNDFGFKDLNSEKRATYVTNGVSRKIIKQLNAPEYIDYFEDKTKFAARFSKYFQRSWICTEGLTYDSFLQFLNGKDKFIYKPVGNAQGQGIRVYGDLTDPENLFHEIILSRDNAILEEWIQQHDSFNQVYDKAINCLRIITIYKDGITHFLAGGGNMGQWHGYCECKCIGHSFPSIF